MNKLDLSDIQGYVIRGYGYPFLYASYIFLNIQDAVQGQKLIGLLMDDLTTGEKWDFGSNELKTTLNIAFTHPGLAALGLPAPTLDSFPGEFQQGMKARSNVLGDTGVNAPENWEEPWNGGGVHVWMAIHAQSAEAREQRCLDLGSAIEKLGGVRWLYRQDGAVLMVDGKPGRIEHFGYTDGFGNPNFDGSEREAHPGQGKLTADGQWEPLATGEFLLGYPDEARELPPMPIPYLLGINGTFMVYRKLHQNVDTFRKYLDEKAALYGGGRELLAAKFAGRWRDGTPLELSPDNPDPTLVADKDRNNAFSYGEDPGGVKCPLGAHIRRVNPRDAFGFHGALVNRRRIIRRGLPYGNYTPEGQPVRDQDEHGIVFMALNASLFRQFEFVQQQWIEYGNDAHQGNDKDLMIGNHGGKGKVMIQGTTDPRNPPFLCGRLPNFVTLRGGEYFFMPSLTALRLIAGGSVDPR